MSVFLTLTEGAEAMTEASVLACRLAKRLKTKVQGISAMPDPAGSLLMTGAGVGLYMPSSAQVLQGVKEAQQNTREKLEKNFKAICASEKMDPEMAFVRHIEGLPEQEFGAAAILSAALVFPHDCGRASGPYGSAFEYTLMSRRQPVIIAGTDKDPDISTIVIAWDGSPEAARAVALHERVICSADRVVIAQNIDRIDPQDMDGPENTSIVREWLEVRNIPMTVREFSGEVADGLLKLTKDEGAGILVAGAFGHSRVEELIFGGVSRTLLRSDHGPALAIAH
ncbi:universal stress protein [Hirschia baltica]|uniref:UspA domain protein n=1 Tax=Hirschia baltica (strain ATCC 49814 / DSM 5838 / IFAM 1418) TaxID=582402 RepID=C6XQM0_HIRBI|nr:universal stress protein [Hirschia baltica]ACT58626.1 UspA domain protein [Hirschia baltica ATCC 49814]